MICKDCYNYPLCEYYENRRKTSKPCRHFVKDIPTEQQTEEKKTELPKCYLKKYGWCKECASRDFCEENTEKQTDTAECEHDYECDKCNDYACEKTDTAEWIFPELVTGRYKCSHCRGNADRTTRFCPYCGYLMSNYNGKAE